MCRTAICLASLISHSAASMAQGGGVAVECVDSTLVQAKVAFDLDFNRQAVTGAFPINWAWFTRGSILFGYSVLINGHHHTMQSYALDRATGMLEICDFAAGGEQACGRRQCFIREKDARFAPPATAE